MSNLNSKLDNLVQKISVRHAIISFVLFTPFLMATLKFWGPSFLQQYGVTVLDLALGINGEQVHDYLTRYGESGRHQYLMFSLFDFFLPFFGAMMIASWWIVLLKNIWPQHPQRWRYGLFIAAIPMLFDWSENIGFLLQWIMFPAVSPVIGDATFIISKIKLFTLSAAQGGFLILLIGWLLLRFFHRRERNA